MTRLTRKFSEVVEEVRIELETMGVTKEHLTSYRQRVDGNGFKFPIGTHFIALHTLYLDYEVQRAAIAKHILNIIKNFDPRLCGPASACNINGEKTTTLYDGQQRSIAMALLGYTEVPGTTVETTDPAFPSYAFEMLNEKGIVKLTPGDMHRNALTRYRLGSREERNVRARTMQDQFDKNEIDLEDSFKSSTLVHSKTRTQQGHALPGASWSAPSMMANFIREVYMINGGTINLPFHGEGASMHVNNNPAPGLFPMEMA